MVKRLSIFALIGAFLGLLSASLLGPMWIAWYNTPAQGQAMCDCKTCVESAASSLLTGQLIGTVIGAVLLLILGAVLSRGNKTPPATGAGTAPPAETPPPPPGPA